MIIRAAKAEGYFIIEGASQDAIEYVKALVEKGKARIQTNGLLVVQNYFRPAFEVIVPSFANHSEMMEWLNENLNSSKAYNYFDNMSDLKFNKIFAGRILAAVEAY